MNTNNDLVFLKSWQNLLLVCVLVMVTGCQTSPKLSSQQHNKVPIPTPVKAPLQDVMQTMLLLYQHHDVWQGTPYRIGGSSSIGIDCSGFVQITYREQFGINLPRTTEQQLRIGQRISRAELQPGDLVFFRNGRHVGIYLEGHNFLHASTTRGVMISSLKNTYWSRHYWQAVSLRR